MRVLTKWLRLESRNFRYKVALYLSYPHSKFEYEIKWNPFEFQAYVQIRLCPKLNWPLGWFYLQPDFTVTVTCNATLWQRTKV